MGHKHGWIAYGNVINRENILMSPRPFFALQLRHAQRPAGRPTLDGSQHVWEPGLIPHRGHRSENKGRGQNTQVISQDREGTYVRT